MKTMISLEEGLHRLKTAVAQAGGTRAYAKALGVSASFVSRALNGHALVTGKLAEDLRLKSVNVYELTLIINDPKQEHYMKQRHAWLEQNGLDPFSQEGIRTTGFKPK